MSLITTRVMWYNLLHCLFITTPLTVKGSLYRPLEHHSHLIGYRHLDLGLHFDWQSSLKRLLALQAVKWIRAKRIRTQHSSYLPPDARDHKLSLKINRFKCSDFLSI